MSIPEEIKRREDRLAKLKEAKKVMEERARERFEQEMDEHEEKLVERKTKERVHRAQDRWQ